jgi:hypothetical protein
MKGIVQFCTIDFYGHFFFFFLYSIRRREGSALAKQDTAAMSVHIIYYT